MADTHVLLIEDDERLARFTEEYLRKNQVDVVRAGDGELGVRLAKNNHFDAIVLDIMLPQRDGLWVCRELRTISDVPILIVTARIEEVDRIIGLDSGADDYLTKPFSVRELLSRIHAAVRRARGQVGPGLQSLCVGPLVLYPATMRATLGGQPIELTSQEFALLRVLAERKGHVLSRQQLLELVKGNSEDVFDRAIDVCVSRIRTKLGNDGRHSSMLRTVRGAGYVLSWDYDI
jgi:two-component system response regulator RstA